jgi:hypothetical protein
MREKQILGKMVYEFENVMSKKTMIEKYKWFSLASGIKDDGKTLKLLKEIIKEGNYRYNN